MLKHLGKPRDPIDANGELVLVRQMPAGNWIVIGRLDRENPSFLSFGTAERYVKSTWYNYKMKTVWLDGREEIR